MEDLKMIVLEEIIKLLKELNVKFDGIDKKLDELISKSK